MNQIADMERIQTIAQALDEANVGLLTALADVIGMAEIEALFQRTQEIEAAGGMLTAQGDRRRSPGGVFFHLARKAVPTGSRQRVFGAFDDANAANRWSPPPAQPDPPTLEQATALLRAAAALPRDKKGLGTLKTAAIGRPKQIKQMDGCTLAVLGMKRPGPMPKGLPPMPDTSQATVAVFIESRLWAKVAPALQADPKDELVVEGYLLIDARNQLTGVWAQRCTTKGLLRAQYGT